MIKDQSDILTSVLAIGPVALDADPTPDAIDLTGYDAATIQIAVGVGGITFTTSNKIEFEMTHCDTADGEFTAVTADDVHGVTPATGGVVLALTAAHAAATITEFGYIGRKGFIKILPNFGGSHATATPMCITVVKGKPKSVAIPS